MRGLAALLVGALSLSHSFSAKAQVQSDEPYQMLMSLARSAQRAVRNGVDLSAVREVSLKAQGRGVPIEYATSLASIALGNQPMLSGAQISELYATDAEEDSIWELASTRDFDNRTILSGASLMALWKSGRIFDFQEFWSNRHRNQEYVQRFEKIQPRLQRLLTSWDIYRCSVLGLAPEDFLLCRSQKPALLVYPAADHNGAFLNDEVSTMIRQVREEYSLRVVFADSEKLLYNAVARTPNLQLLIIAGHGDPEGIALGEDALLQRATATEGEKLTRKDVELIGLLHRLSKHATVVLYSCATGAGMCRGSNFANYVASGAEKRRVIAANAPVTGFLVESLTPLRGMMRAADGTDCTYLPQHCP